MNSIENDILHCGKCDNEIKEADDFCPHCGAIFKDGVNCISHSKHETEGVCIICCKPYCTNCGAWVNGLFLCQEHSNCEIYQGMARIYGVLDDNLAQYIHDYLKESKLHPFLYFRNRPLGGPRMAYTLYEAVGDYNGHIVNEIKIMVPCQEVIEAEEKLKDLKLNDYE